MHVDWRIPTHLMRPMLSVGALILMAAVGWWWLSAPVAETSVPAADLAPVPTSRAQSAVLVDVVGAVRRPGVVRLPAGARVVDAVAAAGGLLPKRAAVVNMARTVIDGEQIVVGVAASSGGVAGATAATAAGGKLDLNRASAEALDGLPGIGPVLASRIVDYRAQHGPFEHVRDLLDVPGIGDAKFSDLSDAVAVS